MEINHLQADLYTVHKSGPLASNLPETCLFSVVIPTYKRPKSLFECLSCLEHYFQGNVQALLGYKIEVIVTDDAYCHELSTLLSNHFPWCKYINGPSRGPAANRNYGAHAASGLWLVFTDDDCLPQPGWIEAYALFSDHCDVMEGRTSSTGVRSRADLECPVNETGGLLWSCNFAIRRSIFQEISGFNEGFPAAAMEDVELNTRVNKARLSRRFVPDALVFHPWRRRKGLRFVNAHARSVAYYVQIHPELAINYTFLAQFIKFLRSVQKAAHDLTTHRLISGLLYGLMLDTASHFLIWIKVRRLGLDTSKTHSSYRTPTLG